MSAKWMRIETDFVDHPKVSRLCGALGNNQGGWFVLRLWSFVSRFCPTGQLRDVPGTAIEAKCEWAGQPGKLMSAFVGAGFLESDGSGGWIVHDWHEHQGIVAAKAQKERERKAEYRKTIRDVPRDTYGTNNGTSHGTDRGPSAGHPCQRDGTGRDGTDKEGPDAKAPASQPFEFTEQIPLMKPKSQKKAYSPEAFKAWVDAMDPDARMVFKQWETSTKQQLPRDDKLLKFVVGLLQNSPVDLLCDAIRGHCADPFWAAKKKFDLRVIFKDASVIASNAAKVRRQPIQE